MSLMDGESFIQADGTQYIERENEVEGILWKRKLMHTRGDQFRTRLARGGQFQSMSALINPGQIGGRKFLPYYIQHPTGATTRIEQCEIGHGRLDCSDHMLTERLIPPIVVLDRAHDIVFFRRHLNLYSSEVSTRLAIARFALRAISRND